MEKETGRLEAFSDGVFAIAMTLLALELKVPHLGPDGPRRASETLAAGLAAQWPGYFAFVTSFFTVLIMWVHHHIIFRLVRRADARLLFTNGLLLMLVTAVPFPTAVLAEYLTSEAAPAACAFYCGVFVLIAVAFYLLLMAAFRRQLLDPGAPEAQVRRLRRNYRYGPPLYLAAAVAAPFSPWVAMGICTALWIFWAAMTRNCEAEADD
ncbi:MAG TPA: TMEM175 family protein [Bryobacteraceae bacterium]|nr:TMEM175 family protein [Bryobacteraceae bacterium]